VASALKADRHGNIDLDDAYNKLLGTDPDTGEYSDGVRPELWTPGTVLR
jgi:hypothetical protein